MEPFKSLEWDEDFNVIKEKRHKDFKELRFHKNTLLHVDMYIILSISHRQVLLSPVGFFLELIKLMSCDKKCPLTLYLLILGQHWPINDKFPNNLLQLYSDAVHLTGRARSYWEGSSEPRTKWKVELYTNNSIKMDMKNKSVILLVYRLFLLP